MNFPSPLSGRDPLAIWLNKLLAASKASRVKQTAGVLPTVGPEGTKLTIERGGKKKDEEDAGTVGEGADYPLTCIARNDVSATFDPAFSGQIYVGGSGYAGDLTTQEFGFYSDGNDYVRREGIASIKPDLSLATPDWFLGTADGTAFKSSVWAMANGSSSTVFYLFIFGHFARVNGVTRSHSVSAGNYGLARLLSDGQVDTAFVPSVYPNAGGGGIPGIPRGLLWDDRQSLLYVVGGFTLLGAGTTRNRIAQYNGSGTLQSAFGSPNTAFGATTYDAVKAASSGSEIYVCGAYAVYNGTAIASSVVRVDSAGNLSGGFDVTKVCNDVATRLLLSGTRLYMGGRFTQYDGQTRNKLLRLNDDASLDTNFNPGSTITSEVTALALLPDGSILVGSIGGGVKKLSQAGALDTAFTPTLTGGTVTVYGIQVESNETITFVGDFTTVNGKTRNRIARLDASGNLLGP